MEDWPCCCIKTSPVGDWPCCCIKASPVGDWPWVVDVKVDDISGAGSPLSGFKIVIPRVLMQLEPM